MLTDAEATAFADTGNTVEDFVPVRSVKNRNIANSLFKFIPRHLEISRSIFAKYLLQPIKVAESEPYLLFNIADKLARYGQLRRYLGWIFIEHHLTIYPSYNEVSALSRRAYLSFAHYTVSFYNIENSLIKIRIYFNANGKVICNQAKIFVERFKPGVEIQLMPEALSVVRHTAQHAQHALRAFIYARDVAYKQAMTHANALLKDLDAESATLTNKAKYIQNARNFIDVIDKINSEYAESTLDLRGKAVEEILHAIESCSIDRMSQSSQIVVTARVEQDAAVIDARENTTITGTVSETAIDTVREAATQAQLIVENCKKLFAKFQSTQKRENKLATYMQAHKLAAKLRAYIVVSMFAENFPKQYRAELDRIDLEAAPFYQLTTKLFEDAAIAGDLTTVTEFYPYFKDQLPLKFFDKLLADMINATEDIDYRIPVCHFFHQQNASFYHLVIRELMSKLMRCPASIGFEFSPLAMLIVKPGKFGLFKMLLDQGVEPNSVAEKDGSNCVSLLMQALSCKQAGIPFALALIDSGAFIEYTEQQTVVAQYSIGKVDYNEINSDRTLYMEYIAGKKKLIAMLAKSKSALFSFVLHIRMQNLDLLQALLPNSSLLNIAKSIAALTFINKGGELKKTTVIGSALYGLHIVSEEAEIDETNTSAKFAKTEVQYPLRMAEIYSCRDESMLASLNLLVQAFREKYDAAVTVAPSKIKEIAVQMLRDIKDLHLQAAYEQDVVEKAKCFVEIIIIYNSILLLSSMMQKPTMQVAEFNVNILKRLVAQENTLMASYKPNAAFSDCVHNKTIQQLQAGIQQLQEQMATKAQAIVPGYSKETASALAIAAMVGELPAAEFAAAVPKCVMSKF